METKINQLLTKLPTGTVGSGRLLERMGLTRQLAYQYVQTGWLKKLGNGAYVRAGDTVDWQGGLYTLQHQLKLSVHVGAVTALNLAGRGHFIPVGNKERVILVSDHKEHLPRWYVKNFLQVRHKTLSLFNYVPENSISRAKHDGFSINVSCPERAIMEQMKLAKSNIEVLYACRLMEGLNLLRPSLVQVLLNNCTSVRVKRLFLWSAENAGHQWMGKLNIAEIGLGKGKRQMYRGGVYNPVWAITVPRQEEIDAL